MSGSDGDAGLVDGPHSVEGADVLNGVALDDHKVGKLGGLEGANLVTEADGAGGNGGEHADDVKWGKVASFDEDLGEVGKIVAVVPGAVDGVGGEADGDAELNQAAGELPAGKNGPDAGGLGLVGSLDGGFGSGGGGGGGAALVNERAKGVGGDVCEGALGGHAAGDVFVEGVATAGEVVPRDVLKGVDACFDGAGDALSAVGVGCNAPAEAVGVLDDGLELLNGVLGAADDAAGGHAAAGGADFDEVGVLLDEAADGGAGLIGGV